MFCQLAAIRQAPHLLLAFSLELAVFFSPGTLFPTTGLGQEAATATQVVAAPKSPYSAYLDLRAALADTPPQTVPSWIEAFEFMPSDGEEKASSVPPADGAAAAFSSAPLTSTPARRPSIFRIRVQSPMKGSNELQMRVFFDDKSLESRPSITAWDELGTELMRSSPLGQGVGLATSETLTIPMNGINYLEIETNGDGSQVRGVFFSWLEKTQIRQPIDFPYVEKATEPFKVISATRKRSEDSYLYGVVTASLQQAPMTLTTAAPTANIQFDLERQPLVAVVSYEILGANVEAPPIIRANSQKLGVLDLLLPDLADPGYQGKSRTGENALSFHYTGWIRAQKVIPGQLLLAGLNELVLELSNGADPFAIRSVEIQLKYNWEKLDYVLAPAPTAAPAR